jgi:peptidoglycan/LPS O-acetylase OafA/YrhL
MGVRALQFCAIVLTALALVPAGAHFFELPNKIGLDQQTYFTVQAICRGWALFGALFANLALTLLLASRRRSYALPLLAFLLVAATLAIFFTWTFPANQATANWTLPTPNWQVLRTHWEYAHATNAILTFIALCLLTWSVVTTRD